MHRSRWSAVGVACLLAVGAGSCSSTPEPAPSNTATTTQEPSVSPTSSESGQPSATGKVTTDLAYAAAAGAAHLLDLYYPAEQYSSDSPAPLVMFIHGGGWLAGDKTMLADGSKNGMDAWRGFLNSNGYVVASVNYRLTEVATFPAQLYDVKAALRYLRANAPDLGLDPNRIVVAGESAGAHLAQLLGLTANRPKLEGNVGTTGVSTAVAGVVSYYGVSDLARLVKDRVAQRCDPGQTGAASPEGALLGGLDPAAAKNASKTAGASPLHYVSAGAVPYLFFHGNRDCLVPHAQTERMVAKLKAAGVTTEATYIDADHAAATFYLDPGLLDQLRTFLAAHSGI